MSSKIKYTNGRVLNKSICDEEFLEMCKEFGRLEASEKSAESNEPVFHKERFLDFVASDETVDSHGDVLRVDGCDMKRLRESGAFVVSHNSRDALASCGVITKVWKDTKAENSPSRKAIMVRVYFPTTEEDEFADTIFRKFKAGTLKNVSVGFYPTEIYEPKDDAERKSLGLGKWGYEVKKWVPFELSAVPVGSNANARKKSIMDEMERAEIKSVLKEIISEEFSELKKSIVGNKQDEQEEEEEEDGDKTGSLELAGLRSFYLDPKSTIKKK